MEKVGIRKAKAQLSAYIRRVKRGETIQITERGKVASELTLIEAYRVLRWAERNRRPDQLKLKDARRRLKQFEGRMEFLPIGPNIVDRCRRPFPVEPIRALDAIHVASAELWKRRVG